jgi:hypothetical protein
MHRRLARSLLPILLARPSLAAPVVRLASPARIHQQRTMSDPAAASPAAPAAGEAPTKSARPSRPCWLAWCQTWGRSLTIKLL